jgi:hypothetical protein
MVRKNERFITLILDLIDGTVSHLQYADHTVLMTENTDDSIVELILSVY